MILILVALIALKTNAVVLVAVPLGLGGLYRGFDHDRPGDLRHSVTRTCTLVEDACQPNACVIVIFYLISRFMQPKGPRQRRSRCLSNGGELVYMTMLLSQTGATGHSRAPLSRSATKCMYAAVAGRGLDP